MRIEGFRSLNQDIETIINKSEAVKKAKSTMEELKGSPTQPVKAKCKWDDAYKVLMYIENKKLEYRDSRAFILSSSLIQTILSASELHRIMPCGSRAVPPVGNYTLP